MFRLMDEARLSPEKAAAILGLSGMTLRRWQAHPPEDELPEMYERAFRAAVQQMVVDGRLPPDSELARSVMAESNLLSFQATIKSMGFSDTLMTQKGDEGEKLILGLSQIGSSPERIQEVEENQKKVSVFAKKSAEWKQRINGLLSVIRSKQLSAVDKLVAYGALFYLLTPFDLVPDTIPVFGLVDDFAILGLAFIYYRKRFPQLFAKRK